MEKNVDETHTKITVRNKNSIEHVINLRILFGVPIQSDYFFFIRTPKPTEYLAASHTNVFMKKLEHKLQTMSFYDYPDIQWRNIERMIASLMDNFSSIKNVLNDVKLKINI